MFISGDQRGRFATSEVSRIFGLEPELDRRDHARHLPCHGQPQGVGLQRQRYQKGIIFGLSLINISVKTNIETSS